MASRPERIGFVGAGAMGHGMAARLLEAGHPVTVIAHRNRGPVEDLLSRGAHEAESLAALAAVSDAVLLCVTNVQAAEAVIDGLAPHLAPGMLVIDTGTSRPEVAQAFEARLAGIGVDFAECPVTGGPKQAAAGALGALVGCRPDLIDRVRPIASAFAKEVRHFGQVGTAARAKLINNYIVMGMMALVAEGFTLADKAGIDWGKLYDVASCGAANSMVLQRVLGGALEGDFRAYMFPMAGGLKDVTYFADMADTDGGRSELAEAVRQVFARAVEAGHADRYLSELLAPDLRIDARWFAPAAPGPDAGAP